LGIARSANDFQRDGATEPLVLSTIHVTHRAGTEVSHQAISRQGLADHPDIMGLARTTCDTNSVLLISGCATATGKRFE
jgi:hypothetical protein